MICFMQKIIYINNYMNHLFTSVKMWKIIVVDLASVVDKLAWHIKIRWFSVIVFFSFKSPTNVFPINPWSKSDASTLFQNDMLFKITVQYVLELDSHSTARFLKNIDTYTNNEFVMSWSWSVFLIGLLKVVYFLLSFVQVNCFPHSFSVQFLK